MIYVVKAGSRVKIGFSDDVPRRLKQLQTGCPEPLTLLVAFPGDMTMERDIHQLLARARVGGEWFTYKGECRAFLKTIIAGAHPRDMTDLSNLMLFACGSHVAAQARKVIADPTSTHEQLRAAHITLRDLTH